MIARLIALSVRHRLLVAVLAAFISVAGFWAFFQLPIDAYPDISAQQVLIITLYPGRAPEEIEQLVTIPIERGMGSVPNVQVIRSRTIFGLSIVELIFDEGVEKYFARQRVQERIAGISLPEGIVPDIGPLATAYGEIYRYDLESDRGHSLIDLRTLNDWVVVPELQRIPGVADVINFGGHEKQYNVKINPGRLERYGLTLNQVVDSVQSNNANAGGSVLQRGETSFVIRGRGLLGDVSQIENTVINTLSGTPVYLRDVADIEIDYRFPSGVFGKDVKNEAIEGIVLMRRGENPSRTLDLVKVKAAELNENSLPAGVRIAPFYDREYLVNGTLATVAHSVLTGVSLVLLVLLAFLGSPSAAVLVVLTIPFSLLFALVLMYLTDIPIGLLSIGAIDFGILVDGAVIMVDNIVHHLSQRKADEPDESVGGTIVQSGVEVERPVFFSMLMIVCAYLPLLTLTSIEGLLFRPMALTVVFALLGAVLFALFVIPGVASFMFRRGFRDWENPVIAWGKQAYAQILRLLLKLRWGVLAAVLLELVAVCGLVVPRLGFDFLPYLDEGVIWIRANFPEGTSLEKTASLGDEMRRMVADNPDVTSVISQAGRNDSGTDPFVPSRLEMMVGLKPVAEWSAASKQDIIAALGDRLRNEFPTTRFNFTQPIIDSVTEDTNGTSANLAVEFSGNDHDALLTLARQTVGVLRQVPGAVDVNIEQEGPQPQLVIVPDRSRCARYNVQIEDVNHVIDVALGGEPIGKFYDGGRSFDIVARFDRQALNSPQAIGRLPVFSQSGIPVPLSNVADISLKEGQTFIAREAGRRRITVRCDIVGRDQ